MTTATGIVKTMPQAGRAPSLLQRVAAEPTLHFVLLAALLFLAHRLVAGPANEVITIDRSQIAWRIQKMEIARGAPPTAEERRQIEQQYIDEQVLVREALAMGLEDDERIHDMLAQKMRHVLSGDVIQPTDAELEAFYERHRARYARAARITINEVVFPSGALPPAIAAQLARGATAEAVIDGDARAVHDVLQEVARDELERMFDTATAGRIWQAPAGIWTGPLVTERGQHWFQVVARTDERPLPMADVRDQVRLDWIAEQEEQRLEARIRALRERYAIVIVGDE